MATRSKSDPRTRDLARIHVLKKDLGLDDDQYRTMLWVVGRVESSKDLDSHGREQVIAHMQAHAKAAKLKTGAPGRPHNADTDKRAEMLKIEALLTDSGKPWAYAAAMARRMFGKDTLEFCGPGELAGLVAALHRQAVKRLSAALEEQLGPAWIDAAQQMAELLFGFKKERSIEKYPEPMSQVHRWLKGELAQACVWPPSPTTPGWRCEMCRKRHG